MDAMDSVKAEIDEAARIIREQNTEIVRLRAQVECLTAAASAHDALRAVYTDPLASQTNKVKAAAAAIGYEQPKLSVTAYVGQRDRKEAWRIYEQWSLRREIMMKIKNPPPKGWDAHLQRDTYQEPPESEGMPPVDVVEDPISGFKVLSNLLPKPGGQRKLGNGGDDSSND